MSRLRIIPIPLFFAVISSLLLTDTVMALDFGSPQQEVFDLSETGLKEIWSGVRLDDGRMLFAGEGETATIFNGWNWKSLKLKGIDSILVLKNGESGKIWYGSTGDFGYIHISGSNVTHHSIAKQYLPEGTNETIRKIFNIGDTVFFFGDYYYYIFNNNRLETEQLSESSKIYPFILDNKLYCKSDDKIFIWENERFADFITNRSLQDKEIRLAWRTKSNQIVFLTKDSIECISEGTIEKVVDFSNINSKRIIPTSNCKLIRNSALIPTNDSGILVFDKDSFTYESIIPYDYKEFKLFEDIAVEDDSYIWLITRNRLFRIQCSRGSRIIHYTLNYPYSELFDSTFRDPYLYFANNEGVFRLSKGNPKPTVVKIFNDIVYGADSDEENLFFSTPWDFVKLNPDGDYEKVLDNTVAISSHFENHNTIWVTTVKDVRKLVFSQESEWKETFKLSGFDGAAVQTEADPEGGRWVATNTGKIVRYENPISDAKSYDQIPDINGIEFQTKDGEVGLFSLAGIPYILTPELIYKWVSDNCFEPISIKDGKSASLEWEWMVPHHFARDEAIWLLRKNIRFGGYELVKISTDESGDNAFYCREIPNQDFLGVIRKIHTIPENGGKETIVITGSEGINFLRLDIQPPIEEPKTPVLSILNTTSDVNRGNPTPVFNEGKEPVPSFQYYTPHFRTDEPMYFQTRLAGLDDNWSEPNKETSRSYPGLRSGRYTFQVRTINCIGKYSNIAAINFRVLPPWYKTTPAIIGYAALLFLLGLTVFNIRLKESKKRADLLEIKVKERTAELEKANRIKSDFVASMSHEIRNPMNGIIGNVRRIKPNQPVTPDILQSLSYSSGYLHRLVKNILDFSKIESGKLTISKEWFDPSGLRNTVKLLFKDMAGRNQINLISAYYGPKRASIYTDQSRVEQVLVNLTSNAIRFTTKGSVRVGIFLKEVDAGNAILTLRVQDTGTGIAKADQARIFEPFVQGSSTSPMGSEEKGTGLGLSIVKDIISTLQGEQQFESELGVGTSFRISIPVEFRSLDDLDPDEQGEKTLIEGRYLITEDLDYNLGIFRAFMQEFGATIDTAKNGAEAFRLLSDRRYDAIFLDWSLPDYEGPEIARMIRQDCFPLNTQTPIIAQTAYTSDEQKQTCMQAGMNEYIEKPISPDKILDKLRTLCPDKIKTVHVEPEEVDDSAEETDRLARNEVNFETSKMMALIHGVDLSTEIQKEIMTPFEKLIRIVIEKLQSGDRATARAAAHQLKNLLQIVQIRHSVEFFSQLQHTIDKEDPISLNNLMAEFDRECEHVRQLIQAHLEFEAENSRSKSQ